MKKITSILVLALTAMIASAKESVLVVCAHPDDSIAIAGTLWLMRDKFDIHVADLTKGQRGLGENGFLDGSTAAKRTVEEENAAARLGSTVHWLGFEDGALYATPDVCESIRKLIVELNPRAIFAMWPIDRHQDHAMAGAATLKAMRLAKYDGEFYYYEQVYGSKGFVPQYFVDVSNVIDWKQSYVRCHVCQNENDYMNKVEMHGARGRGYKAFYDCGRAYVECFSPLAGFKVQGSRCIFSELKSLPEPTHLIGKISECNDFVGINPLFAKAFDFMKRTDLATLAPGRYDIDGTNCWAMIMDSDLVPVAERQFEAHREFIDIQTPISGPEKYGLLEPDEQQLALPFDTARDFVLFRATGREMTLKPGEFAIFFPPKGAHAPACRADGGPAKIRKLVIKVRAKCN